MYKPSDIENKLELYMEPIQIKARNMFLEIVKKHGNGLYAFDELEWLIYVVGIDEYEALNKEEKFALNMYMRSFRSLYK